VNFPPSMGQREIRLREDKVKEGVPACAIFFSVLCKARPAEQVDE